jgi:hypothetical protein
MPGSRKQARDSQPGDTQNHREDTHRRERDMHRVHRPRPTHRRWPGSDRPKEAINPSPKCQARHPRRHMRLASRPRARSKSQAKPPTHRRQPNYTANHPSPKRQAKQPNQRNRPNHRNYSSRASRSRPNHHGHPSLPTNRPSHHGPNRCENHSSRRNRPGAPNRRGLPSHRTRRSPGSQRDSGPNRHEGRQDP